MYGGYGGDGGPANEALLLAPQGVAVNADGDLYIADTGNARVRKVANGIITTYAGTGGKAFSGDGGPATEAQLHVSQLRFDSSGILYLSDAGNGRIRAVLPSGLIFTVAGNGKSGDTGDGGPATHASMSNGGIANGVSGTLSVPEPATNRIRKLTPVTTAATVVSAASSLVGLLAPGSIATAYGPDLANGTLPATTVPLPLALSGTTVNILDAAGVSVAAPLFFVSPGQVNFFIPPSVADGTATATFTSGDGTVSVASLTIAAVSPGLFLLNSANLAAANVITADASGAQVYSNDFEVTNGAITALPTNLGQPGTTVYLVLYGTGISGRDSLANVSVSIAGITLPAAYAGPQGETGLDQVNVQIPASLAGSGTVNVTVTVDGVVSNTATITIM